MLQVSKSFFQSKKHHKSRVQRSFSLRLVVDWRRVPRFPAKMTLVHARVLLRIYVRNQWGIDSFLNWIVLTVFMKKKFTCLLVDYKDYLRSSSCRNWWGTSSVTASIEMSPTAPKPLKFTSGEVNWSWFNAAHGFSEPRHFLGCIGPCTLVQEILGKLASLELSLI